jgi:hypothetical protein
LYVVAISLGKKNGDKKNVIFKKKFCSTNGPDGACCNTLNSFIKYGFGPEKNAHM